MDATTLSKALWNKGELFHSPQWASGKVIREMGKDSKAEFSQWVYEWEKKMVRNSMTEVAKAAK